MDNITVNNLTNNIETINISSILVNNENLNITIDNNTINNLTENIQRFANINIIPENAETLLFPDIRKLLYLSIKMRKQLLSKWKYYNEFLLTIDEHSNNQQTNRLLSWEQSFTMTLLLYIYN